jgi:uncharacterized protein YdbL (DUF1318 family)
MKSLSFVRLLFVFAALSIGGAVTLQAQDPALKARIEKRVGSVNALKDKGVAGENNQGYLEARGGASAADQQIISEENSDRRAVYAAIAAKTKASADQVGQKRAAQIASLARKGHWVQDASGAWKQK